MIKDFEYFSLKTPMTECIFLEEYIDECHVSYHKGDIIDVKDCGEQGWLNIIGSPFTYLIIPKHVLVPIK